VDVLTLLGMQRVIFGVLRRVAVTRGCGRRIFGGLTKDLPEKGDGRGIRYVAWFRRELHGRLWRRGDSLFELADAVLAALGPVASLPYLSLEPAFRRGHGMVYQALAEGGIDEEALRDLLVAVWPRDWPLAFATGASTYPRPEAECSPDRGFHHHWVPSAAGIETG
jgi:hypothetical protein